MDPKEILLEQLKEIEALIGSNKIIQLNKYLEEIHPRDIAEIIIEIDEEKQPLIFEILPWDIAGKVLDELDSETFLSIFSNITIEQKKRLLDLMSQDDMVDLLNELDEDERTRIVNLLEGEDAEDIKELLVYEEDTAGGIMTTDYIAIKKDISVYQAIEELREKAPDAETVYYIYVVDKNEKLVGVMSLRELIIAKPNTPIEKIMIESVISAYINDDQEEVAKTVSKYDLLAIPVVDSNDRLRGIITVDDIIDVIEEEATEDIYKFAGTSESESEYLEEEKFTLRVLHSVKARLPWLIITLFGGVLSARILGRYEGTLQLYPAVAFFMPMLTGMGGNVGTQSSTLTVRGLATGHVDSNKGLKTVFQEMSVGTSVGIICSALICLVTFLWMKDIRLGIVVGLAMAANIITASTIGTLVPIIFKKFGVDPAVASAPFISTTLDITGITIYFTLATIMLLNMS